MYMCFNEKAKVQRPVRFRFALSRDQLRKMRYQIGENTRQLPGPVLACQGFREQRIACIDRGADACIDTVSYTHLTLPTNREV